MRFIHENNGWPAFHWSDGPVLTALVANRLLDGFEGHLSSAKYARMAKCSTDTALRDIQDLVSRGILARNPAGGRSTSYRLVASASRR